MVDETVIPQGSSVKRRQRRVKLIKEEEQKVKVEPYTDPEAKPAPTYKFAKIVISPTQIENENLNFILNNMARVIRWDEKILPDNSLMITIIYVEKPRKTEVK